MKKPSQIIFTVLMFAVGLLVFGSTQILAATTRTVDNGTIDCPAATFTSIQAAVTASAPGDTVQVCAGIYPEQVVIRIPLTVIGISANNHSRPEVRPPAGGLVVNTTRPFGAPEAAMVLVDTPVPSGDVNIFNITVNGLGNVPIDTAGIYYRNAGGTILNNAVKNVRNANPGTTISGGILVGNSDGTTSTQTSVLNNVVVDYEKFGILAQRDGTFVTVGGNYIFGLGFDSAPNFPTNPGIAQNGIEIGFGANGNINNNRVSNNIYRGCTPTTQCAGSIVIYDVAPSTTPLLVELNNISKSNVGIISQGASGGFRTTNGATYRLNFIHKTELGDGMDIEGNNNTILENKILNTDGTAIQLLSGSTGNSITNNVINDAAIGIARVDSGNTQSNNTFINVDQNVSPAPPAPFRPQNARSRSTVIDKKPITNSASSFRISPTQ
ncbi:MAG: hypothetical protein M3033_03810 [Acidobacteriota bacterium]|nr:hypothetical protein [Acidobacteriota bacterium]